MTRAILIGLFTASILTVIDFTTAPVFGATCADMMSTQALSFTAPVYGPAGSYQAISLTPGLGNPWSITNGGSVSITKDITQATSGNGNTTVYSRVSNFGFRTVGTSTDTVQFTFGAPNNLVCNLVNTIVTTARTNIDNAGNPYTNPAGLADTALPGSSSSGSWAVANDLVPGSNVGSIPGGSYLLPAQGSTATLPVWGATVRTCSPPNYRLPYSSFRNMNANNTAIIAIGPSNVLSLISFPACVTHSFTLTPPLDVTTDPPHWMPGHPTDAYYFNGNSIYKVVFNLSTYTAGTPTSVYTCAGATTISNGGTDDITEDGWLSFQSDRNCQTGSAAHPNLCTIDLSQSPPVAYCGDLGAVPGFAPGVSGGFNYTMQSRGFDSRTNKRYVWTNVNAPPPKYGPKYSLTRGATSLVFENIFSVTTEAGGPPYTNKVCTPSEQAVDWCQDMEQHSVAVEDSAKRQYLVSADITPRDFSGVGMGMIDLTVSDTTSTDALPGGGATFLVPVNGAPAANYGSANGWVSYNPDYGAIASCTITGAVTNGANIALTTTDNPCSAFITGDPIRVDSVGGCTNANGAYGSVTVSGNQVTISGVNCNGTYTAGTGVAYKNTYPATQSFRFETILSHISNNGAIRTIRLGDTLARPYSESYTGESYWENGKCTLSFDAQFLVCISNGGIADAPRVVVFNAVQGGSLLAGQNMFAGKATIQ